MRRTIFAGLLGMSAGLWEVAVRPFLTPAWMFRPLLPLVIILLIASRRQRALAAAIGGALLIDLYAMPGFDFALLRWIVLVFLLDALIRRILTHRSLYAAVSLVLVGRMLERSSAWIMGNISVWIGWSDVRWSWNGWWWVPYLWDIGIVTVVFFCLTFFTKRFVSFIQRP